MNIAIPTHDGLSITADFGHAKGFLILTTELCEIVNEEIRWNKLSDILTKPEGFLCNIMDCEVVIVQGIGKHYLQLIEAMNKEVVLTKEAFITNAYIQYLNKNQRKQAKPCV